MATQDPLRVQGERRKSHTDNAPPGFLYGAHALSPVGWMRHSVLRASTRRAALRLARRANAQLSA